jgi:hypothetical protein
MPRIYAVILRTCFLNGLIIKVGSNYSGNLPKKDEYKGLFMLLLTGEGKISVNSSSRG